MKRVTKTQAPHGTANRYNNIGCRCVDCKAAWAAYILAHRRKAGVPSRSLKRRGYRRDDAAFPDKTEEKHDIRLTPIGEQLLAADMVRTGLRDEDVMEGCLRYCAGRQWFTDPAAGLLSTE